LDKVSSFLSILRNIPKPFGGIQVILSGDFCQLPPINGKFCFHGEAWSKLNLCTCVLTSIIRQDDTGFQQILNELRFGICSDESYALFKKLKHTTFTGDILPTKLYPLNIDIDSINTNEISKLQSEGSSIKRFKMNYFSNENAKKWADSIKVPEYVDLCIGAQVMVTYNVDQSTYLINGTRGVITDIYENSVSIKTVDNTKHDIQYIELVCEDNNNIMIKFMPLKLAYAVSIHKSQGMTLDCVEIDMGKSIFEYGQAYVALSRVRSLKNVKFVNLKRSVIKAHPDVIKFYTQ
jgi:ATP-dependent DNA helicase PIF1